MAKFPFFLPLLLGLAAVAGLCRAEQSVPLPRPTIGSIERLEPLHSAYLSDRTVDVWLPPGYSNKQKYAVLYMQDGQMLFDAGITWNKQEWQADEVAAKLMAEGKVQPFIIVGVHNGGAARHSEYFPQKPFQALPKTLQSTLLASAPGQPGLFSVPVNSDNYLKFLAKELKPYIDSHFSVHTDARHTAVLGSSMGGLISLYAVSEYPDVFGSAACLSTHWPGVVPSDDNPVPEAFFAYMREHLPDPGTHRLYFDHGTETLDAVYPLLQVKADAVIKAKGYTAANWQTQVFPGADHSEKSWSMRLAIPLQFLFPIEDVR